ncbi:MAG: glycosyltransferase, partial [Flavobacteriaceae bacterium]|nr:glycosyltransferase [Flavobacteriaceae bacterium]
KKTVLVRGVFEEQEHEIYQGNLRIVNYLLSPDLERELNQSRLVICRSGYSSIMDLARLGKKAFFIPTKGQNEQEYLAKYLEMNQIAPYESIDQFKINNLEKIKLYKGFEIFETNLNDRLLHLFKGKRKS